MYISTFVYMYTMYCTSRVLHLRELLHVYMCTYTHMHKIPSVELLYAQQRGDTTEKYTIVNSHSPIHTHPVPQCQERCLLTLSTQAESAVNPNIHEHCRLL